MSFQALGLSDKLLSAIQQQGYTEPTPVQSQAIPAIIQGRDVRAAAQTGTGKTAGFTLPLLHRLSANPTTKKGVRALILTPTRELAAQVHDSVKTYGKHLPFRACAVYGGMNIKPQIVRIKRGCEIVIATPGRLLDLVRQRALNLSSIEIVVLDEADRMLDMGFIDDIRHILSMLPKKRQSLLFSATYSENIKTLAKQLLHDPVSIDISKSNTTVENITQIIHPVDKSRKRELLSFIIGSRNWEQVLVFTRTKHGADTLAKQLESDGLKSAAIHGDKTQGARTRVLAAFKKGKVRVLVATDVAARGLDIKKLPHVVNFELPYVPEDYVHRIGRTGRASNEGLATSLVSVDELNLLHDIEKLLRRQLPQEVVAGYEPDPSIKAKPTRRRKRSSGSKQNHSRRSRGAGRASDAGRGAAKRSDSRKFSGKKRSEGRSERSSERGSERSPRKFSAKKRSEKNAERGFEKSPRKFSATKRSESGSERGAEKGPRKFSAKKRPGKFSSRATTKDGAKFSTKRSEKGTKKRADRSPGKFSAKRSDKSGGARSGRASGKQFSGRGKPSSGRSHGGSARRK